MGKDQGVTKQPVITKGEEGRGMGEGVTPNRLMATTSHATARYNPEVAITP